MIVLSLVLGLLFAPLAAAMAYIITVGEYAHHYADKRTPVRHGLQAAAVTFLVFMALAAGAGLALQSMAPVRTGPSGAAGERPAQWTSNDAHPAVQRP